MKIRPLRRKEALSYRASWYADRNQGGPPHLAGSRGFEAGYRAAMRDLRTELKDPSKHFAVVVRDFLRPIR